jgi:ADP-ribose pyrophosphatase
MIFKEETIESQYLYKGKILNLRKDLVHSASGGTTHREIVEHRGGVGLAAITDEGRMVLVRQYRKALSRDILEIPAGKLELGEEPEITAARELKEETGYRAGSMEFLGRFYPSVGYTTECIHLFLCRDLIPGETEFDEGESIETEEYPLEELYHKALRGEIEDGKTLATILMVAGRQHESMD